MAQESDKLSPMLKQYLDIKQKYSGQSYPDPFA